MPAPKETALTEHESHVLAIIQREQPVTTYKIRKFIEGSPTAGISSSAGAVYPLVRRLTEQGYISVSAVETDRRNTEVLQITDKGRSAIRDWIRRLTPAQYLPEDPARTRAFYMAHLPVEEQVSWLTGLISGLERKLGELEDYAARLPAAEHAHRHALMITRTRIEWAQGVLFDLGSKRTS